MTYKSRRSKACDIPSKVKQEVSERDFGRCILCGKPGKPNAHYISRAAGGLGIIQNTVTLCDDCHYTYDHTEERKNLKPIVKRYLDRHYPDFQEKDRYYKNDYLQRKARKTSRRFADD